MRAVNVGCSCLNEARALVNLNEWRHNWLFDFKTCSLRVKRERLKWALIHSQVSFLVKIFRFFAKY